jgi:hypothetical protein
MLIYIIQFSIIKTTITAVSHAISTQNDLDNLKCDQLCRSTNQEVVDFFDDVWEETFDGKGPLAFIEVWLSISISITMTHNSL